MFRITTRTAGDELVLLLEGYLHGEWVKELEGCWRDGAKIAHGRRIRVDLGDVCHIDEAGRVLLTEMLRSGVQLVAKGCFMPEFVRELSEEVLSVPGGAGNPSSGSATGLAAAGKIDR